MTNLYSYIIEAINKKSGDDEYYTRLKDIEKELSNYDFNNKIVYCNCDDPDKSNFYKYFKDNFDKLKLKKLYCTYLSNNPQLYEYDGKEIITTSIESGKFEDNEEYIKKSDIIVTNPPYSNKLPNKLIELCIKNNKKFIIVAQLHLIQSKEIFEMYKNNEIFIGYTLIHTFERPDKSIQGIASSWWTNIEVKHNPLTLIKKYNKNDYPKYDKYDAIEVSKYKDIPKDYKGLMGVPYNFINHLSKEQFDVIDIIRPKINGKNIMMRLIIKLKGA